MYYYGAAKDYKKLITEKKKKKRREKKRKTKLRLCLWHGGCPDSVEWSVGDAVGVSG